MKIYGRKKPQIKCLVFTNSKEKSVMESDQFAEMISELKIIYSNKNKEINDKTKNLIEKLEKVKQGQNQIELKVKQNYEGIEKNKLPGLSQE